MVAWFWILEIACTFTLTVGCLWVGRWSVGLPGREPTYEHFPTAPTRSAASCVPTGWQPSAPAFKRGEIDADTLRATEDRAITDAVRQQEAIGLQSITDGGSAATGGTWTSWRSWKASR